MPGRRWRSTAAGWLRWAADSLAPPAARPAAGVIPGGGMQPLPGGTPVSIRSIDLAGAPEHWIQLFVGAGLTSGGDSGGGGTGSSGGEGADGDGLRAVSDARRGRRGRTGARLPARLFIGRRVVESEGPGQQGVTGGARNVTAAGQQETGTRIPGHGSGGAGTGARQGSDQGPAQTFAPAPISRLLSASANSAPAAARNFPQRAGWTSGPPTPPAATPSAPAAVPPAALSGPPRPRPVSMPGFRSMPPAGSSLAPLPRILPHRRPASAQPLPSEPRGAPTRPPLAFDPLPSPGRMRTSWPKATGPSATGAPGFPAGTAPIASRSQAPMGDTVPAEEEQAAGTQRAALTGQWPELPVRPAAPAVVAAPELLEQSLARNYRLRDEQRAV